MAAALTSSLRRIPDLYNIKQTDVTLHERIQKGHA
jgi:hypothetical protein